MASINLKKISKPDDQSFSLAENRTEFQRNGWRWSDIKMDMEIGDIITNFPTDQPINQADAQWLLDEEAVKQSVKNIFNTTPGEKLLNPLLGLDLKQFLFSPITERTANNIGRMIVEGLVEQEPRIAVKKIKVEGVISHEAYYISFVVVFPNLESRSVNIDGTLNSDGFSLTSENREYQPKPRNVRDRYWNFNN